MTGTFLNTLKFIVKDCDPNTGEPDDDDHGFADEYVVSEGEGGREGSLRSNTLC